MKYKTTWDLGLLYKSDKDPQIEKDMKSIEQACLNFEKKYKGKDFTSTPEKLFKALKDYGQLLIDSTYKPMWYLHLYKDIANDNPQIVAMESQMNQRQIQAFNHILFFELELAKISKDNQLAYIKNPDLKYYQYYLKKIFNNSKYNLSEKEEQLQSLLSQPAEKMWFDAQQKLLSGQNVQYKNEQIPLTKATEIVYSIKKLKERHALYNEIVKARKITGHLAEAEINAIYNYKKINDEIRGYTKPYSQSLLRYENDDTEIEQLIETITKNFSLSSKYYKLHKKILGLPKITIADIYLPLAESKIKFDFNSAIDIVKRSFTKFDIKYANLLEAYLQNGQIDVYPKKGKRGGGYCSGLAQFPVFIFLNYSEKLESVETLAHEMGHAIHTELSKHLNPFYGDYTISVAEVASTFFEQFVAEDLIDILPDNEKITVLHSRLGRDIAVVFRQIACFNYQLELHNKIRSNGQLTQTEMAQLMQKHLKSYMGNAVEVTEDDGYVFTTWTHLRYDFYTYTYAYGYLISRALYQKWKENNNFKDKIEKFLSAGNTMSPKEIFKSIGINTNAAFFEAGLKGIEADIKKLEKLAKKQKLIQ